MISLVSLALVAALAPAEGPVVHRFPLDAVLADAETSTDLLPLETWILPKAHRRDLLEFTPKESASFMQLLQKLITKQSTIYPDYVIAFHQSPKGEDFHFHAEFYPRRNYWAGLELGAGLSVNSRSEQDAVAALKD